MNDHDFAQCEFIHLNMNFINYYDFCENCYGIKKLYQSLDKYAKRFYKWYVYANIHMDLFYKDKIWNFLNSDEPTIFLDLLDAKRTYKIK